MLIPSEVELLLSNTAAARSSDSVRGCGVVLVPSQIELCTCEGENADAHARLIAKLFNAGLKDQHESQ